MTIAEECGCGATFTIAVERGEYAAVHAADMAAQWRRDHQHAVGQAVPTPTVYAVAPQTG